MSAEVDAAIVAFCLPRTTDVELPTEDTFSIMADDAFGLGDASTSKLSLLAVLPRVRYRNLLFFV